MRRVPEWRKSEMKRNLNNMFGGAGSQCISGALIQDKRALEPSSPSTGLDFMIMIRSELSALIADATR